VRQGAAENRPPGLKPHLFNAGYAALKGRSSTVVHALWIFQ